ncbi:hypothetical protein [uncultured Methanobrevibacter sp.]|uniref:hypothetical protein n=1 Tax=uncultured Methanobrevibacter sp. TaxID=253161 RepID=UPI0025EC3236|nr:hypothetical protein [uncultured Methanobrevibacter sp.]
MMLPIDDGSKGDIPTPDESKGDVSDSDVSDNDNSIDDVPIDEDDDLPVIDGNAFDGDSDMDDPNYVPDIPIEGDSHDYIIPIHNEDSYDAKENSVVIIDNTDKNSYNNGDKDQEVSIDSSIDADITSNVQENIDCIGDDSTLIDDIQLNLSLDVYGVQEEEDYDATSPLDHVKNYNKRGYQLLTIRNNTDIEYFNDELFKSNNSIYEIRKTIDLKNLNLSYKVPDKNDRPSLQIRTFEPQNNLLSVYLNNTLFIDLEDIREANANESFTEGLSAMENPVPTFFSEKTILFEIAHVFT